MTLEQHPTDPDKLVFRAVCPAFPTGNGMPLREAAQQALEALEIGYDAAKAEADHFHSAMAGYKPQRHAQMDADVQKIAKAITALRAALAEEAMQRLTDVQQEIEAALQSEGTAQTDIKPEPVQPVALTEQVKKSLLWPVAWIDIDEHGQRHGLRYYSDGNRQEVPLFTAPPQRKPLTDEEIDELVRQNFGYITAWQGPFVRAIERAHGITGGSDE